MYHPERFMTVDVLSQVLSEFEWPAPYTLEDWLPDSIGVVFPKCTLTFSEGFESDMQLKFLDRDTGLGNSVTLNEVLISMGGPDTPGLIDYFSPGASLEKVQNEVRDLCTMVLTHFKATLLGDFSWVESYKEYVARSRSPD